MKSTFWSEKNTHLEHPEDLVVMHEDGVIAVQKIFSAIITHMLEYGQTPSWLTIKYDGAPAVFYWRDPESGRFFLSTKSVFAANAKKALRKSDIKNLWQWPLAQKLSAVRPHLKKYTWSAIIQWDLLFVRDVWDLQERFIDNENWITWRPNTLLYAAQWTTSDADRIRSSSIWLINHTLYRSDQSWKPVVVGNSPKQLNSSAVWTPPLFPTLADDYAQIIQWRCTQLLDEINSLDNSVSWQLNTLLLSIDQRATRQFMVPWEEIEENKWDVTKKKKKKEPSMVTPMILPLRESYIRYTNLTIRKWTVSQTPEQRFTDFTRRYLDEYASKIAKLQRKRDIFRYELWKRFLTIVFKKRGERVFSVLHTQQQIVQIKEWIIDLLETSRVPDVTCFLPQWSSYIGNWVEWSKVLPFETTVRDDTSSISYAANLKRIGYIPTWHEGYVMRTKQWAIKLVKRAVFSRANFIEPKLWWKSLQEHSEAEKQHHWLFFFARMNPPTKQHIAFLRMMVTMAQESGVPYYFFLSHSQDNNNPLLQELKWAIIKAAIPEIKIIYCGNEVKTLYDAVRFASNQWCTDLWIIGWADREEVIEELQEKKQEYGLNQITGIRLGDREFWQDVANEKQISWTMTRQFAREWNFEQFSRCFDEQVPESLIQEAYESIRVVK